MCLLVRECLPSTTCWMISEGSGHGRARPQERMAVLRGVFVGLKNWSGGGSGMITGWRHGGRWRKEAGCSSWSWRMGRGGNGDIPWRRAGAYENCHGERRKWVAPVIVGINAPFPCSPHPCMHCFNFRVVGCRRSEGMGVRVQVRVRVRVRVRVPVEG